MNVYTDFLKIRSNNPEYPDYNQAYTDLRYLYGCLLGIITGKPLFTPPEVEEAIERKSRGSERVAFGLRLLWFPIHCRIALATQPEPDIEDFENHLRVTMRSMDLDKTSPYPVWHHLEDENIKKLPLEREWFPRLQAMHALVITRHQGQLAAAAFIGS